MDSDSNLNLTDPTVQKGNRSEKYPSQTSSQASVTRTSTPKERSITLLAESIMSTLPLHSTTGQGAPPPPSPPNVATATAINVNNIIANPDQHGIPSANVYHTLTRESIQLSPSSVQASQTRPRSHSIEQPPSPPHQPFQHLPPGAAATAPFLQTFSLVAEAATRAQMTTMTRDLESVSLTTAGCDGGGLVRGEDGVHDFGG